MYKAYGIERNDKHYSHTTHNQVQVYSKRRDDHVEDPDLHRSQINANILDIVVHDRKR